MSIVRERVRRILPYAILLGFVPLAGDAVNNIQCCNVASSYATSLFGGGSGDEDFFMVPAGSPNLMVLLSNSSRMLDFPSPLPIPALGNNGDNWTALDNLACKALGMDPGCTYTAATTYLNNATGTTIAASATPPFDNGRASSTTVLVNDAPPWGLPAPDGNGTCTPTTGGDCLFTRTSYYHYRTTSTSDLNGLIGTGGLGDRTVSWSTAGAHEITTTATACGATYNVPSTANCASALTNKGYYLYQDGNGANATYRALFAGWFLNLYPPKFVMARKIVKDIAMIDTDRPGPIDSVRIGLAVLKPKVKGNRNSQGTSIGATDGGTLLVPLGPNCSVAGTFPFRYDDMVEPRQAIVSAINDATKVPFYDEANTNEINNQLAETLYAIGQYYSNYSAAGNVYTRMFGSSWVNTTANWAQTSPGTINASWATVAGQTQASFCFKCQQGAVVIVTDGLPKYDNNLPQGSATTHPNLMVGGDGTGDFRNWTNGKIACAGCGNDLAPSNTPIANLLHKVAYFLNQTDLRPETGMEKLQQVVTYVVSFGVPPGSAAETLLQKTAELGGGTFTNAADADELMQAMNDAALAVTARGTGFSVAATPTLQTSQNTQLLLARFRPLHSPAWEGHLYRFRVFNEFAEGCDSSRSTAAQIRTICTKKSGGTVQLNPNLNGDQVSGKAVCTGVFILDADCDTVVENDDGDFKKATFSGSVLVAGTTDAVPYWDAGNVLSNSAATGYRSADESATNRRKIYTVVDGNADGKYTSADGLVEFKTTIAAADWTRLKASLGLDAAYCTTLFGKMGVLNSSAAFNPTTGGATALDECAKQVVWFIRGFDVLDEDDDGCGGPDFPSNTASCASGTNGEERNRANDSRDTDYKTFWKLGDIFHSSPALSKPPAPTLVCDLALDPQCVATIHSPQALSGAVQTPMASYTVSGNTIDAYDKYRRDGAQRKRVALVGANDGMLHAIDAGSAISGTADAGGNYQFDEGTGAELWAFIPPDLLPKLKNALIEHDYFVDGDTMVRDVWVDGSGVENATKDGRKQSDEFHTVAILSERSGGTQYVALDVSDPSTPAFRWTYPQPCSLDASMVGQSWTGFAPRPPPIGPIKLAVTTSGPQDPLGRGFEERWIAMINGGYDASLTRGRGIWMMDAWSGATLWRFTNDEFVDNVNAEGGMWPVPGSAALLDIGVGNLPRVDSDGFFDSATWGDIGGQIYVARFASPDKTNWAAARAFEEQRQDDDGQVIANRSEFYLMPANTVDPKTGYLHTYLGSGNRERLMVSGVDCGPNNVFGCFQAGCNTDVTVKYDYGSCSYVVKAHSNNGDIKQDRSSTDGTACTDSGITCNQVNLDFKVVTVCNGWKPVGGNFHAALVCNSSGVCSSQEKVKKGSNAPSSKLVDPRTHNRFYGIWAYGGAGRMFDTVAEATTFDANRFTDITFTGPCAGPAGGACKLKDVTYATVDAQGAVTCSVGSDCSAGNYDPGWFYEYGRAAACPLTGSCGASDWTDEKTASGAGVLSSCVIWNTFRPAAGVATTPCTATSGAARNYAYLADFISGVPTPSCGVGNATVPTAYARATMTSGIAPPTQWAPAVTRSKSGGSLFQQLAFPAGGSPQAQQVGVGGDSNQTIYWLEVPRGLHACRHTDVTQCD